MISTRMLKKPLDYPMKNIDGCWKKPAKRRFVFRCIGISNVVCRFLQPPILILNIEVVEAKDLEAKDANGKTASSSVSCRCHLRILGFSDPYCMLGIVPDAHASMLTHQSSNAGGASSDDEGANDSKLGFIKRLKSFRKSTVRRAQGREKSMSVTGASCLRNKLPAKYIQTTDVKKATLNPKWMEKFRL